MNISRTMPRLGTASWVRALAVGIALLMVCWFVVERSTAAFSDTTSNPGNSLTAGGLGLSDSKNGQALFAVSNMVDGQQETRCLEVTYTGTSPVIETRLYLQSTENALSPYLDMTVDVGGANSTCAAPGAVANQYTGTLGDFTTRFPDYDRSLGTGFTPVSPGDVRRAFILSLTLDGANDVQGKQARPTFVWEVRTS